MRVRRRREEHASHERWLVSYADFITLLFALFVVLFAASNADNEKVRAFAQSVANAIEHSGVRAAAAYAPAIIKAEPALNSTYFALVESLAPEIANNQV